MSAGIIVSCISKSWGGLEIMALENLKQMKKQGLDATLMCLHNSPLQEKAKANGFVDVININDKGKISNIKLIQKHLQGVKVIHTHHSHDLWMLVPAMRLCKSNAKLFLTRHLASGINKKDLFHRYLYKRVKRIFAISEFIKKNTMQTIPVNESEITVLPNGIDLDKFNKQHCDRNKTRADLNIDDDKLVISLIGRITPGKGHYEFIKAAEIINKTSSGNVIFMVVGSSAPGEEGIEDEIRGLASALPNIKFTGFRSDVRDILAATDILAFPSHDESFGITLLEAMAMEVPIAAAISGGVPEIIPSEEFGVLISPKNAEALADGLMKLINDAELRKKLGSNGRRRVEEHYDLEKITAELIKFYELE